MIGGAARQLRTRDLDAGYFKPWDCKDVVDAHRRETAGIGASGAVVLRFDLYVLEAPGESAVHSR
nr:hypothetical protein [Desulfuromonas sp. KJ2020]